MRITILVFFILSGFWAKAQVDSVQRDSIFPMLFGDCDESYFHRPCGSRFAKTSRRLAIMPEYQFGNLAFSLGISHVFSEHGEGGGMGTGFTLNAGFLTRRNAYTASFSGWRYFVFVGAGGVIGGRSIFYWDARGNKTFALRPEIGLVLFNAQFKYGYDFRLNKDEIGLRHTHNLTISFYLPIYPRW